MKSYSALHDDDSHIDSHSKYPKRVKSIGNVVNPRYAYFDLISSKPKRKLPTSLVREKPDIGTDGHYRKHHRKF